MLTMIYGFLNKYVFYFVGAVVAYIAYLLKIKSAKKQGKDEVIGEYIKKSNEVLKEYYGEKEKIQNLLKKDTIGLPDSWDVVNELRKKGARSMREIADANVRESTGKPKKRLQKSKPKRVSKSS